MKDSSSESELSDLELMECENSGKSSDEMQDTKMCVGDYVLVKFATKKTLIHYVGKIENLYEADEEYDINFLRKSSARSFSFPYSKDTALVGREDIVVMILKTKIQ